MTITELRDAASKRLAGPAAQRGSRSAAIVAALVAGFAIAVMLAPQAPGGLGVLVAAIGLAIVLTVAGLRDPVWAYVFLIITLFFRYATPHVPPTNPFLVAFGGLVLSTLIWLGNDRSRRIPLGMLELTMLLYLAWNTWSMLGPHEFTPVVDPLTGEMLSVWRYIFIGTAMPFAAYVISRSIFVSERAVKILLGTVLFCGAYSAYVSIMQFNGPRALVWPKYVVDAPPWIGRACGLANQPQVNGIILITGYAIALMLAGRRHQPTWQRLMYIVIAVACTYATYLTRTRAVWLCMVAVVLLGIVLAKGYRTGFVVTALGAVGIVVLNWSTFTSSDRDAGGVGSSGEVQDRFNAFATAWWGFLHKPWSGWGVGRFTNFNTHMHRQFAPDVDWERGLGIAAHQNEMGILAELGIVGFVIWIAVLVMVWWKLIVAYRQLPAEGLLGKRLAFVAIAAFGSLQLSGFFVDLRMFDIPSILCFGLVGAAVGAAERSTRSQELSTAT